ncbi:hypothetical protein [Streptococcus pacificus]|uniref:DUF1189 domain-containing protein n=1 Tax=Streptococcus pacificus TaxID=2740577 RepID=A0ABS0ZHU3_9STRE|nr:hypothetical protein [Streptococcus pacificus]MBJ8325565.1 hypothetical protein [Streptococcus pacificus]
MNNFNLLFKNVDPNDKKGLSEKGFVVAKLLRIFAIIAIIITLIIAIPVILGGSLLAGLGLENAGEVNPEIAVTGGIFLAVFGFIVLLFTIIGQIITLWYTGKLKKQFAQNEIPSSVLPIVFLVFSLLSVYGNLRPEFNTFGVLLNGFIAYLWFVIINIIKNLKNME